MKVLVTGGAGFVGLALTEALLQAGHDVVCFDRRTPPREFEGCTGATQGRLTVFQGDVCRTQDLRAALLVDPSCPVTHVFHGAAMTPNEQTEATQAHRIVAVNLSASIDLVRLAAECGVKRFVFASSLTVYGEHLHGPHELDEEATPPAPSSLYAITKYAAERAVLDSGRQCGLPVVCGRIGAVFGPWETDSKVRDLLTPYHQVARLAVRGAAAVLPAVYAPREMIYVRDLARALMLLLQAGEPAHPVYNLSVNADWHDLLPRWCETLEGRMPGFDWRYARDGEASTVRFHVNRARAPMATARLRQDLGFSPRYGPDAALRDYADWLVAHGRAAG